MKRIRRANGQFAAQGEFYLDAKGYPRYGTRGPLRGKYVHRVMWEKYHKRKLKPDEDVHHKDGNKLNFAKDNLKKLGHREHGFVSAKQHYWVGKVMEERDRQEWDEYFEEATA